MFQKSKYMVSIASFIAPILTAIIFISFIPTAQAKTLAQATPESAQIIDVQQTVPLVIEIEDGGYPTTLILTLDVQSLIGLIRGEVVSTDMRLDVTTEVAVVDKIEVTIGEPRQLSVERIDNAPQENAESDETPIVSVVIPDTPLPTPTVTSAISPTARISTAMISLPSLTPTSTLSNSMVSESATITPTQIPSQIVVSIPTANEVISPTTSADISTTLSTQQLFTGIVSHDTNLREAPNIASPVVAKARANQQFEIVAQSDDGNWYQVVEGGWIASIFVSGGPTSLPTRTPIVILTSTPTPPVTEELPTSLPTPSPTASPISIPTATPVASANSVPQATDSDSEETSINTVQIIRLDKFKEYVALQNQGDRTVNLRDWRITSEEGNQSWTIPFDYMLEPNAIVYIHAGIGPERVANNLYSQLGPNIWVDHASDPAVLYGPTGVEVSRHE